MKTPSHPDLTLIKRLISTEYSHPGSQFANDRALAYGNMYFE
ncbi:hypothetical protein [Dyadobacter sp. CY323]|nr:hypothetical protein [Dyadobacter sp. CY323]